MSCLLFARQELLALRRDPRAWAAGVCLLVLLAAALGSSEQMQRAYERTRTDAQQASQRQWLSQGKKNPHSAAHFGMYAFRPPPELAPFDPGVHRLLGTTIWLEAHKANDLRDAPDEDGSRSTYLDDSAAFLARTVLPLLVFLLVASSLAGERERGTLKMLRAQGASVLHIVLGKLVAFSALLVGSICVAALTASIVSGASAARLLGLGVGYTLFTLVALFVAMVVSVGARDTRRALVALFSLWTLGTMLGPRIAASTASALAPMPLRSEAQAALERELDPSGYTRRTDALRARVLAEHGVDKVEALPFDFRGLALQRDEEHGAAIYDRHRAAIRGRESEQDRMLERASILLPWLALEQWSTAIVGSDRRHAEHFADAAERHRRAFIGQLNDYLLHAHGAEGDEALWAKVPPFQYQMPDVNFAWNYAWRSLVSLVLWAAASLAAALLFARRAEDQEVGA